MFFIFNKDKVISYAVTVFTVIALFLTASVFNKTEESIQTSVNESSILETNNINEVENKEENTIEIINETNNIK